jgi:BirA family biotin operon repressor/biotin-[acetyl-CoA-carboxylase] ligase
MPTSDPDHDAATLLAKTFLRHVELHDELPSTNDRAAILARELPAEKLPTLVLARRQTAGRGRGTNTWWSADGALTFSILLETSAWRLTQRDWPQLSLAIAAAVRDAIAPYLQSAIHNPKSAIVLKAPNDLLLEGRKLCGILLESPAVVAPAKDRLIIGIGLNVNNTFAAAPPEVAARAISLRDATQSNHKLADVLVDVLKKIEARLVAGVCDPGPAAL